MVRRLEAHQLSPGHHTWTGNDDKRRHHQNRILRSESPLYIQLSWKESSDAPARLIGCYELDMSRLLPAGYIREDGPGHVRQRIFHVDDGGIYYPIPSDRDTQGRGHRRDIT